LTRTILIIAGIFATGSCGYYGMSVSLPSHLKTVAVPLFSNETLEYGVDQKLTDAVVSELIDDNSLGVVDVDGADSVIEGTILSYEEEVYGYDQEGNVREYRVQFTARVLFRDLRREEISWEEQMTGWATYSVSGEESRTEEEAQSEAISKLAEDIVSRAVKGW
jgi:hypothetical protein